MVRFLSFTKVTVVDHINIDQREESFGRKQELSFQVYFCTNLNSFDRRRRPNVIFTDARHGRKNHPAHRGIFRVPKKSFV